MINNFEEQLEEYRDARRNAFVTALSINSAGRHIAGVFGVNIPREILWALDIVPINIYSIDDSNIKAAEEIMGMESCSLIKASYGYSITGKCPFTHFSDIIVGNNMCSNKSFMIEKLANFKKTYIISNHSSVDSLVLEYYNFVYYLEQVFDFKICENKLTYAIKKTNEINKKMKEILNLCILNPNVIDCEDLYSIIYGSQFILDLDERYDKLAAITKSLESINFKLPSADNNKQKKILISGVPQAGLKEKILKPLSEIKNVSVSFAPSLCEGESYKLVDETRNPYKALAEKYLCLQTSQGVGDLAVELKADAIINASLVGCHSLSENFTYLLKPYLDITTDYSDNDSEDISKKILCFVNNL